MGCTGGEEGRIDRIAPDDGSVQTIWRQQGVDRAFGASFGGFADEYWLTLDHKGGRQFTLVHVHGGRQDLVATVDRAAEWQYVSAPLQAPDESTLLLWLDLGAKRGAVLVPLNGAPPTFHRGPFAGFVDSSASALFARGPYVAPAEAMPTAGERYRLPSIEELIAAEIKPIPGRRVLGKATHEAVDGELVRRTYEVPSDQPGAGGAYLDCIGPSSVTVTAGPQSVTSPCLQAGSSVLTIDATGPITVSASGDTSWRVVIYAP
jgi:hypothetical protein